MSNAYKVSIEHLEGGEHMGRTRRRRIDKTEMDLK
jgi:hypothetical protein